MIKSLNFFTESRILSSRREYFCRVENYFFELNPDIHFCPIEIFLSTQVSFLETRIPFFITQLSLFKLLTVICMEDLEKFLLYIQGCISHIEQCTVPGKERNMEYMHDCLEAFFKIISAFSLVLAMSHKRTTESTGTLLNVFHSVQTSTNDLL